MKKLFSLLAILLISFSVIYAQNKQVLRLDGTSISAIQIDSTVQYLMNEAKIQGLGLAVINNKKTVFIQSYGYKNKPKNELLDTATIMYGASLSKAVFGYISMKLVQDKKLDLDKPLYQYLPKPIADYEYFSDLKSDDRWKLITARMCLSHTSGLPNLRWFHPATGAEDSLGVMKIYLTPGTKYAYSGEGLKLLQLIIEEITHQPLEDLAIQYVFKPFNMNRTGYIWHNSFGDNNVAVGHYNNGAIDIKKKRTTAVSGGSMVTTIADFSKFVENIMQQKGLNKALFNEMIAPQIAIHSKTQFPPITTDTTNENDNIHLSYGLGWGVFDCKYGKAFFKEGNGDSWRNYNINFIDKGISIIILVNSENGEKIFQPLIESIIGKSFIPWKWNGYVPYNAPINP